MAGRKIILATDEYYHVFNRGIARQPIFFTKRDYERFLLTTSYYRFVNPPLKLSRLLQLSQELRNEYFKNLLTSNKLVDITSFVLMPNHFHFILRQNHDRGISIFMSQLTNSYTRYINTKQERMGDLMQGVFKAVHIETDEQMLHLSRYIHLNPVTAHLITLEKLSAYRWSSFLDYLQEKSTLLEPHIVLSQFKSPKEYEQFVHDQAGYQHELKKIEHLLFE
ncbi:hypothetical protein C4579_02565 [Candidatus Microgenomates bacterium]|nr:MAG: hypothetical protein C4579_02565 [Candidatus Microgenomates bacterium]